MQTCSTCKNVKALDNFRVKHRNKNGIPYRLTTCKDCDNAKSRARHKRNYDSNPNFYRAKTIASKIPSRIKVIEHLRANPCVDCGNSDIRVLEFDHRDPSQKIDAVSSMLRKGRPWKLIEEEMQKCDIRCANCHRIKTAFDNDFYGYLSIGGDIAFEHVLDWYNQKNI